MIGLNNSINNHRMKYEIILFQILNVTDMIPDCDNDENRILL